MPADGATSVAGEMCKSRSVLVFIIKIIEIIYGRPLLLGEHVTTRAAVGKLLSSARESGKPDISKMRQNSQ